MNEKEIIEEIKLYCRIDEDEGEAEGFKESAEEYLFNAGIKKDYKSKLYFLVIKMLAKHWYDNRKITTNKSTEIPYGVTCIINQLQLSNLGDINAT